MLDMGLLGAPQPLLIPSSSSVMSRPGAMGAPAALCCVHSHALQLQSTVSPAAGQSQAARGQPGGEGVRGASSRHVCAVVSPVVILVASVTLYEACVISFMF